MDKTESNFGHAISISERKNIVITGVKKIDSFDSEEFLLETSMGYMLIKGNELEIIKLDTIQGNITIKGKLNLLSYIEDKKSKDKEEGVFNRLFK